MSSSLCPVCQQEIPLGAAVCPRDGTPSGFEPTVVRKGAPQAPALSGAEEAIEPTLVRKRVIAPPDAEPTVVHKGTARIEAEGFEPTVVRKSGEIRAPAPAPAAAPGDQLIGTMAGEYVLKGTLGEGGMGIVYEGSHPLIGKRVAVKVLRKEIAANKEEAQRLLAEARAANSIGHRGIIDIFGFGALPDGRPYVIMEYLQGRSLEAHLEEHAPLPVADALKLLDEILSALGAAHAAGVIHRDLKPTNIFLVSQPGGVPFVKLLDFGLAKRAMVAGGDTPQTQIARFTGTPSFVAPEQARGEPVGPRSDLYSLGIVAFQMLTGRLPFEAPLAWEVVRMHLTAPPPSPGSWVRGLPEELDALILQLLAKTPGARPASAEEVKQRLAEIGRAERADVTQANLPAMPRRPQPSAASAGVPWADEPSGKRLVKNPSATRPTVPLEPASPATAKFEAGAAPTKLPLPPTTRRQPEVSTEALASPPRSPLLLVGAGVGVLVLIAVASLVMRSPATVEPPPKTLQVEVVTPPVVRPAEPPTPEVPTPIPSPPVTPVPEKVTPVKPVPEKVTPVKREPPRPVKDPLLARYERLVKAWGQEKKKRPPEDVRPFDRALEALGRRVAEPGADRKALASELDVFATEALGRKVP